VFRGADIFEGGAELALRAGPPSFLRAPNGGVELRPLGVTKALFVEPPWFSFKRTLRVVRSTRLPVTATHHERVDVDLRHLICPDHDFLREGRDGLVGGVQARGPIVSNERLDLLGGEESRTETAPCCSVQTLHFAREAATTVINSNRRRSRCEAMAAMPTIGRAHPPSWLFSPQKEPLEAEICRDEEANRTDPDRHGPLSYHHVPTVDEPQRVEEGDQCEDRAGYENKGVLFHRPCLLCFRPPRIFTPTPSPPPPPAPARTACPSRGISSPR